MQVSMQNVGCATNVPVASCIDPRPPNLHHTPGFLSGDYGGGATGLVVWFIVPIIPCELLETYRKEQSQGDHNKDLTNNIPVRKSGNIGLKLTGLALQTHSSANHELASCTGRGSHCFRLVGKASDTTPPTKSALPDDGKGRARVLKRSDRASDKLIPNPKHGSDKILSIHIYS